LDNEEKGCALDKMQKDTWDAPTQEHVVTAAAAAAAATTTACASSLVVSSEHHVCRSRLRLLRLLPALPRAFHVHTGRLCSMLPLHLGQGYT
jgi:hypothetical protein